MCDTVVIVLPDRVYLAKNSDRDPNEAQLLDWQPHRQHAKDARVRCTWVSLPQIPETFAVLLSRPYWCWGAEMGTNEHGVTIGNEAVFTREPVARSGLTGMDLTRLALERSARAEDAVALLTELVETVGQGGGAGHENPGFRYHNSFLVADPRTAFVLETAGRHWAVDRITGTRTISNALTIEPFADHYSDLLKTHVASAHARQARTQVLAEASGGPADLMRLLRDHGAGQRAPRYRLTNGALGAPCVHAGGLAAASQTTASWVAELRPGRSAHWVTGTAAPCTGLFKPVAVDTPLDLGPPVTDAADARAIWWRHERLHRCVMRDPERLLGPYTEQRDAIEARWLASPPAPADAWAEADDHLVRWTEAALASAKGLADQRPWWVRRYWRIRNRRAGLTP